MTGAVDRIRFSLSSTADFEDRKLASKIVDVIFALPPSVRPQIFGAFKPLECRVESPDELVDMLVNARGPKAGLRGGSLLLGSGDALGYSIQWNKSQRPEFAFIGGSIGIAGAEKDFRILGDWLEAIKAFVRLLNPSYGEVRSMESGAGVPRNLLRGLPDVPAIAIYGNEYVGFFGPKKIENAPFLEIEKLGDCYWLVAQRELRVPVPEEVRRKIRTYFGEDAFVCDLTSKPRKNGRVPKFERR